MPAAPAVGGAEIGYGQLKHPGELFRHFAFAPAWPGHRDRSKHLRFRCKIIDVPSQRFGLLAVSFEPGREIALGASYIVIDSFSKEKPSELAHGNMPVSGQVE